MTLRDSLLANASWYRRWKQLIRADRTMRSFIEDHLQPRDGDAVLDVGCGDGDVRPMLPGVDYTGVDFNPDYLRVARQQEDESTRFVAADVGSLEGLGLGPFDVAFAMGVLHHLSDPTADSLLDQVHRALVPNGRFVTIDPVFDPEQRTLARVLAALDRGRYVRDQSGYKRLYEPRFTIEKISIRNDLLPFPYTHCVIEAVRSAD